MLVKDLLRMFGQLAVALLTAATVAGCGAESAADAPIDVPPPPAPIGPALPDVVSQPLDLAKSTLQAAGFTGHSQDLLRDRSQIVDSNWTVCSQNPGPGPEEASTVVELGVVKDSERCPGSAPTTTATATATTTATTPPAAPAPKPAPKPAPAPDPKPAEDPEPDPDTGRRTGNTGHPCLPGERDGDNDGYCDE